MQFQNNKEKILIIDFGSQVTKLIARRIREIGVYSEIITPKKVFKLNDYNKIKGIIFSGGPSTVTKKIFKQFLKIFSQKYTNSWYLLRFTINCKITWRKNKVF